MNYCDFEEIIGKIDGVINSKVITSDDEIMEVHILANRKRSAKQIVRDIESALLVSFDYKIDRNKLSIAQIYTEDEPATTDRIKFQGLSAKTCDNAFECYVELSYNDKTYSVTETGVNTPARRMKTIASSTLKTIQNIFSHDVVLDVMDVLTNKVNDITFASVLINMLSDDEDEVLLGSAIVKNDINEAVVKAVLDAVNRRIQKYSA